MTKILSCLVIVAAAIGSANSGTSDWIGGSGSWSVGANWHEEPPAAGDTAVLETTTGVSGGFAGVEANMPLPLFGRWGNAYATAFARRASWRESVYVLV